MRTQRFRVAGISLCGLLVACVGRFGRPERAPVRTVVLRRNYGLSAVEVEVTLQQQASGEVTGGLTVMSGAGNRANVADAFACTPLPSAADEDTWVCAPARAIAAPKTILATLDRLGIMVPPRPADPPMLVCTDGTPWSLEVRGSNGEALVVSRQGCGPTEPRRAAFESGIDSVLTAVETQVRRKSTP